MNIRWLKSLATQRKCRASFLCSEHFKENGSDVSDSRNFFIVAEVATNRTLAARTIGELSLLLVLRRRSLFFFSFSPSLFLALLFISPCLVIFLSMQHEKSKSYNKASRGIPYSRRCLLDDVSISYIRYFFLLFSGKKTINSKLKFLDWR